MNLRDRSGWINWPDYMDHTTSLGETWVGAYVPAWDPDPFVHSFDAANGIMLTTPTMIAEPAPEVFPVRDQPPLSVPDSLPDREAADSFHRAVEEWCYLHADAGAPMLAALVLGTAQGVWQHPGCTRPDLTVPGRALVDSLQALYQRPVVLVTHYRLHRDFSTDRKS